MRGTPLASISIALLLAIALSLVASSKASADAQSEGRNFFITNCIACHAFSCNKEGPRLGGLFGRSAGSVDDYDGYSDKLKGAGLVWDEATLDLFFQNPGEWVRGSMADYGKIESPEERSLTIAYLKTEDPSVNLCPES